MGLQFNQHNNITVDVGMKGIMNLKNSWDLKQSSSKIIS